MGETGGSERAVILVAETLQPLGLEILEREAEVVVDLDLAPERLVARLNEIGAAALVVRSGTQVDRALIEAVPTLRVIGRAGTGVDNIDLQAATEQGILVVNAPTGNSVAAAEHAIALMMALARNIPQADAALRAGVWNRHAFIGRALAGKTLGVVALGRVGYEVARRGRGLGMQVIAHDPYFPAERAEALGVQMVGLDEIWSRSDVISLHAPLTETTKGLISEETLKKMKRGVFLINDARGGLVDDVALAAALDSGQVGGAALDVFQEEPPPASHPLVGRPDVIATPHLGASTTEAQLDVAREIAEAVLGALRGEPVPSMVNAPMISPELLAEARPFIELAEKLAQLAVQHGKGGLGQVRVTYEGRAALPDSRPLKAAVIKGLLEPISEARVNRVNAELIARERGISISETRKESREGALQDTITIEIGNGSARRVQGAILRGSPHVVRIQDFWIDLELGGCILLCHNRDRPGMIGQVGMLLGAAEVNISFMQVGRDHPRGVAVMAIGLDETPPEALLRDIVALPDVTSAELIDIR